MTDEEAAERQEIEAQALATMDAIQEAVRRMLREDDIHPHLVLLGMARVTGGLGAATAMAEGRDVETMLGEVVEIVRQAGLEHHEELQAVLLPTAGSA